MGDTDGRTTAHEPVGRHDMVSRAPRLSLAWEPEAARRYDQVGCPMPTCGARFSRKSSPTGRPADDVARHLRRDLGIRDGIELSRRLAAAEGIARIHDRVVDARLASEGGRDGAEGLG